MPSNGSPYQLATPDHALIALVGGEGLGAWTLVVISNTTRGHERAADEMARLLDMGWDGPKHLIVPHPLAWAQWFSG